MRLVVETGQARGFVLTCEGTGEWTIGRDRASSLVIADERVSRHHAAIRVDADGAFLIDLGSSNGTELDGRRVREPTPLSEGAHVRVGDTVCRVEGAPKIPRREVIHEAPGPVRPPGSRRGWRWALAAAGAGIVIGAVGLGAALWQPFGNDTPPPPPARELDAADVIARAERSTALIEVSIDGEPVGSGSGWVYDAGRGLIATNDHVVAGADEIRVRVNGRTREGRLHATAPCEDLAIVQVRDREGLVPLRLGSQSALRLGEEVVALGFPASTAEEPQLTATRGIISVARTRLELETSDVPQYENLVQTDAALNPGNSGGPLLDVAQGGRLVGVNTAGLSDLDGRPIENQGFAIGIDRVRQVLATLRKGTSLQATGLEFGYPETTLDQVVAGLPDDVGGLLVTGITPGSPADSAGIDAPALLQAVSGRAMDATFATYCDALADVPRGIAPEVSIVEPGGLEEQVRLAID